MIITALIITCLCCIGAWEVLTFAEDRKTCRRSTDGDYIIRISEQYIDHCKDCRKIGEYVLKCINEMEDDINDL